MRDRSPIRLRAPLLAHRGDQCAVRNGLTVVLAKYRPGASILASSRPSVKRSAVACARARRVLATARGASWTRVSLHPGAPWSIYERQGQGPYWRGCAWSILKGESAIQ